MRLRRSPGCGLSGFPGRARRGDPLPACLPPAAHCRTRGSDPHGGCTQPMPHGGQGRQGRPL